MSPNSRAVWDLLDARACLCTTAIYTRLDLVVVESHG
jgi:hypothetical protein